METIFENEEEGSQRGDDNLSSERHSSKNSLENCRTGREIESKSENWSDKKRGREIESKSENWSDKN